MWPSVSVGRGQCCHEPGRRTPSPHSAQSYVSLSLAQGANSPGLVRLGFLDHVKRQQGLRVFPGLKPDTRAKLTGQFSKCWGRYAKAAGVKNTKKTFHGFRYTFEDACRRADIRDEHHDALTGHSNGSVGRKYGLGVALRVLAGAVGKLSDPGVDCLDL